MGWIQHTNRIRRNETQIRGKWRRIRWLKGNVRLMQKQTYCKECFQGLYVVTENGSEKVCVRLLLLQENFFSEFVDLIQTCWVTRTLSISTPFLAWKSLYINKLLLWICRHQIIVRWSKYTPDANNSPCTDFNWFRTGSGPESAGVSCVLQSEPSQHYITCLNGCGCHESWVSKALFI